VIVDEVFAREKIGQSLRDGLSTKYKSATKFKKRPRKVSETKLHCDIDKVVQSNHFVSRRMSELSRQVERSGDVASDLAIVNLFSLANSEILETIKRDHSMLRQFQGSSTRSSSTENNPY